MLHMNPNSVPAEKTSNPTVEMGVYPGVISMIVDLGMQREKLFELKDKPDEACTPADYKPVEHQLWYSFCLPTERYEHEYEGEISERDQILGKCYKVSRSDKSNLVIMYKAVVKDGRSFGEMLGMPVTITSGITSGGNSKVVSVAAPMRGSSVGDPLRPLLLVTEDMWGDVDSLDLPDFLKEKIKTRIQA